MAGRPRVRRLTTGDLPASSAKAGVREIQERRQRAWINQHVVEELIDLPEPIHAAIVTLLGRRPRPDAQRIADFFGVLRQTVEVIGRAHRHPD